MSKKGGQGDVGMISDAANQNIVSQQGGPESEMQAAQAQAVAAQRHSAAMHRFQNPTIFPRDGGQSGRHLLPARYDTYSDDYDYLRAKNTLRSGLKTGGPVIDTLDEREVNAAVRIEAANRAADFDYWLHSNIDYTKPGVAGFLQKVAPGFVESRVQQLRRDAWVDFNEKFIKQFGPQSRDDLEFQYGRERGYIKTSEELKTRQEEESKRDIYHAGRYSILHPEQFKAGTESVDGVDKWSGDRWVASGTSSGYGMSGHYTIA